jgi:SDR family mycofactocin-dependent oxidoreductase
MGRVQGKVALVTGAARGMGRSHAVRLAEEGADIVAVDLCADLDSAPYPGAGSHDLDETAKLVEQLGQRVIARQADVRDSQALKAVVDETVAEFGYIDVVVANAGISGFGFSWELSDEAWQEMIDINLTGSWKTVKAAIPQMIERGQGGSIIFINSAQGLIGVPTMSHYTASKHGVVGLMRALAAELAPHGIRSNTVNPGNVDTPMVDNAPIRRMSLPHLSDPTREDAENVMRGMSALPVGWLDPREISDAVLFLASEETRHITGITLPVDAGMTMPSKLPHM